MKPEKFEKFVRDIRIVMEEEGQLEEFNSWLQNKLDSGTKPRDIVLEMLSDLKKEFKRRMKRD